MVGEAKGRVENLTPGQVAAELEGGNVTLVDVREDYERARGGSIPGAERAPRGMLEFWADPTSPYHRKELDPARRTILFCALGGRSALAADTLQGMGYGNVAHLDGGIKAWKEAGYPVQEAFWPASSVLKVFPPLPTLVAFLRLGRAPKGDAPPPPGTGKHKRRAF